ncbi:1-deoxy-D-xylulose 5-phosphate reductoisomerase [Desulfocicer vacuolatum DSM 3385]|uniref:1-deoxy-D-xylulose 5-phosphate reductoisomerase n=1 Tax=Desulfocicer vacuolatum DSM 3385 TaxID=1121400 RepID=A0A1W2BTR7_9BACT|nr:1-deoxy-D-xylulose-5-phosphate reductoisomerase [Desulfocicer vacuolatum]SMC76281.1 1-deoxy-D-xylulose 5-phosphate reductoisomerase [Desulfocicer vacuolatum DSM 3385]
MRQLSILGSTGSIGQSALAVVARYPHRFNVRILAAANNVTLLARQIEMFAPDMVAVINREKARELKSLIPDTSSVDVLWGEKGYLVAASHDMVDTVLLAMVGAAGLMPALAAIDAQKKVALANKETLVMAGEIVMARAAEKQVTVYPVDSEHSAIFQCLEGNRQRDLRKIFLTASGGPFRLIPRERFSSLTPKDALSHPTWDMGAKISIDSATLMNKALEIIEAVHLFKLMPDQVEVVVHPQSIVHSMVGFSDGTVMAQMGLPDMKAAISYALSWPERLDLGLDFPDFPDLAGLFFEAPDREKFPSIDFAFKALEAGGTLPGVMNAANEVAVDGFLNHAIGFLDIFHIIETTMSAHKVIPSPGVADIVAADGWARERAGAMVETI